jgi:hypothetical protein
MKQNLYGSIGLLLEDAVGVRSLGQRQAVGGEILHTEGVVLAQQREQVDPMVHIGLAHAELLICGTTAVSFLGCKCHCPSWRDIEVVLEVQSSSTFALAAYWVLARQRVPA